MPVLIQCVQPKSPAARAGVMAGDTLLSISGQSVGDVLDYRFHMMNSRLDLELLRGGKPYSVAIKKGEYDELGLEFETYLMDKQHACKNKCIFCFIDQMPPDMRESLYFKDDDSRMSFLFGNYITLTNLTDDDIDRIIKMHISPVNVSVHTTDPELRVRMMKNPHAGDSLRFLRRLADAGIRLNTQLVLVPDYNDGDALVRSLNELAELAPALQSIACVPVGLTRFRDNLPELRLFDKDGARAVVDAIERFGVGMQEKHGVRIAHASDEFFLKAQLPIPPTQYYGDFDQLENGVGLIALLRDEFDAAIAEDTDIGAPARLAMATGAGAYPLISEFAGRVSEKHPNVHIEVREIKNCFFGETITVAGLVTGSDLREQLAGISADRLLLPSVMLRREGDRFLDDVTPLELEQALGIPITMVDNDGWALYDAMMGRM